MVRAIGVLAATACALVLAIAPAGAVTGSFQLDDRHGYVALVTLLDEDGNLVQRCTGSLLNQWTVLTAGHCVDAGAGVASAVVYAQRDAGVHLDDTLGYDPVTGYPLFCAAGNEALCSTGHELHNYGNVAAVDTRDLGVVILDDPIVLDRYATVAAPDGGFDALAARSGKSGLTFTVSGFGISDVKPAVVSYRQRLMATERLINTHNQLTAGFNLQLTSNPGGDKGGACFADSGGPVLFGTGDTIVGVNSFLNDKNCTGSNFAYRVDATAAITWLTGHAKGAVQLAPLR
jgi:hypothetical protein